MLDSYGSAFDSGFNNGQTKDHAILARSLGVTQIVCAVNKLDAGGWKEERYDEICQKVKPYLLSIGFKDQNITFVPVSAFLGENLTDRESQPDALKAWYGSEKRGGEEPKCLLECIEAFKPFPKVVNKPVRACVYDYYHQVLDGKSNISGDCISVKVQ